MEIVGKTKHTFLKSKKRLAKKREKMKKNKLSIAKLSILSFVTNVKTENSATIKGGDSGGASAVCPVSNRYDVCKYVKSLGDPRGWCTGDPVNCPGEGQWVERSAIHYACTHELICDVDNY